MTLQEQLKSAERNEKRYQALEQNATNVVDRVKYRKLKNKFSDLADKIFNKLVLKY